MTFFTISKQALIKYLCFRISIEVLNAVAMKWHNGYLYFFIFGCKDEQALRDYCCSERLMPAFCCASALKNKLLPSVELR